MYVMAFLALVITKDFQMTTTITGLIMTLSGISYFFVISYGPIMFEGIPPRLVIACSFFLVATCQLLVGSLHMFGF